MKNTLLALLLSLSACAAQAAPEQVSVTFETKNATTTIYPEIGDFTPISAGGSSSSAKCTTRRRDFPSTSVMSAKVKDSFHATVLPLKSDDKGVEAYVYMTIGKNDGMTGVKLDYDCDLLVGSSVSSTVGLKETFAWGKPRKLVLESGTVTITFDKIQKAP